MTEPASVTPDDDDQSEPAIRKPEADEAVQPWKGSEQTLVGPPSPVLRPITRPITPAPASGETWRGDENTIVPASGDPSAPWRGDEVTLAGVPAPGIPAGAVPVGGGESWRGDERTLVGTPGSPAGPTPTPVGATRGPKTTAGFEEGWHFAGRKGPLTGTTFGDFEVGGILGEGGMGTVYRAKQLSLRRRAALKVLPAALSNDAGLKARFEQEAQTASLLQSPNVVQVYAAGTVEGQSYFAMEFVEGTDLSAIIREHQQANQPFAPEEAARYVIQAAKGLSEAGKLGIVHRDIKPANLMVTGKGVVKIADFGIAKMAGTHGLTMTGTAVGTPAYCSPEQGRGEQVDPRADLYSLGVVLYELLTGKKPFDGTTPNALIYQHNYAEPPLPSEVRPDLPPEYQAIVLRCLQKDPAQRYQDAAELAGDLERVVAGSAPMTALLSAFGTGADEAMRRLGIHRRRIWPLVVAVLLVAAAGLGTWLYIRSQSGVENEVAKLRDLLRPLDDAAAIDAGAGDNLARLAELAGKDDNDVGRWSAKLVRVDGLRQGLARLDAGDLPDATLRRAATADLDRLRAEVGGEGEDLARWAGRLKAADEAEAALRRDLAALDAAEVVTVALDERLTPTLDRLLRLAGAEDADAKRWNGLLAASRNRRTVLRQELKPLDDEGDLTAAAIRTKRSALAEWRRLAAEGDTDAGRWGQRLDRAEARIAALRQNLARFDQTGTVTVGLIAALKDDLAVFSALADADDPDLKRWRGRVDEATTAITEQKRRLSALDAPGDRPVAELKMLTETLTEFGKRVGGDDGELQAWTRAVEKQRGRHAALAETLRRLDDEAPLAQAEIDGCEAALTAWHVLGGIGDERRGVLAERLRREKAAIAALRTRLNEAAGCDEAIAGTVRDLARRVGDDDALVAKWRADLTAWSAAREALQILDRPAPHPDNVADLMATVTRLSAPGNAEVPRWRGEIERVGQLAEALSVLDRRQLPQPEAGAQLTELAGLLGDDEARVRRWRARLERINTLRTIIEPVGNTVVVLPTGADQVLTELAEMVGAEDPGIARLATRVRILRGPPRPAWASGFGRDRYGLWADAAVQGVTLRLRYVPAGPYTAGSPDGEVGREADEVRVPMTLTDGLWLADSECTQALYQAVTGGNPSRFKSLERPVERVSVEDVRAFLVALNQQVPGLNARLPWEVEWEAACRAGVDAPWVGEAGAVVEADLGDLAWMRANAGAGTHEVRQRYPNPLGLFDLHGNVWEWCEDAYGEYPPTATDDWRGRGGSGKRVARGGSWGDAPRSLRAANRLAVEAQMRTVYLGFRLAAPLDWQAATPAPAAAPAETAALAPAPPAAEAAPSTPAAPVAETAAAP